MWRSGLEAKLESEQTSASRGELPTFMVGPRFGAFGSSKQKCLDRNPEVPQIRLVPSLSISASPPALMVQPFLTSTARPYTLLLKSPERVPRNKCGRYDPQSPPTTPRNRSRTHAKRGITRTRTEFLLAPATRPGLCGSGSVGSRSRLQRQGRPRSQEHRRSCCGEVLIPVLRQPCPDVKGSANRKPLTCNPEPAACQAGSALPTLAASGFKLLLSDCFPELP